MALIFGPIYFGGYGKIQKGIVLAIIGFIPLTAIAANVYAAFRANAELPVGEVPFNWGNAAIMIVIQFVISVTSYTLINS